MRVKYSAKNKNNKEIISMEVIIASDWWLSASGEMLGD